MDEDYKDEMYIGGRIRELRVNKGYTQKYLGECLNVTENSVGKWERGEVYIPLCELLAIARLFEVDCSELLPATKNDSPFEETVYKYPANDWSEVNKRYPAETCVAVYEADFWPDFNDNEIYYKICRTLNGDMALYYVSGYCEEYTEYGSTIPYIYLNSCDRNTNIKRKIRISDITGGKYYLRRINKTTDIPKKIPYVRNQWILDDIEDKLYFK